MDPTYWHDRWREGRIGFHREEVDPQLTRFFPRVNPTPASKVLVPLCGKSLDLIWLRDRGHRVTGVEIAPQACQAFVEAHGLTKDLPDGSTSGRSVDPFERWRSGGLELLCGDIFELTESDFDGAWDRAALIALPPEMRARYAAHTLDRLRPGGAILLVTAEYDPKEMAGPPFSVSAEEVSDIYRGATREVLFESEQNEEDASRLRLSRLTLRTQVIRKDG